MDIATLLGMVGAVAVVLWSIQRTGQLEMFTTDWFSPLFVLCGTLLGVMVRYSMGHFLSSLKVVAQTFSSQKNDPQLLIDEIVNLATVSRKDGLLALEKSRSQSLFWKKACKCLSMAAMAMS